MDRRQLKTRKAIFDAFTQLLKTKKMNGITVQEIIDLADIGRSTFYAHFETKDELVGALCSEVFDHVINSAMDVNHTHGLYSDGTAPNSVFLHILQHLEENDHNILTLFSCDENEVFMQYFKRQMNALVKSQLKEENPQAQVPEDFLINHISGSFVDMVQWWVKKNRHLTPQELNQYFEYVNKRLLK